MWYPAKITTAATEEPVTLDEVKRRLRIGFEDDDDDIGIMIKGARDHVEKYCNTRLAPQTVELKCDRFADFCYLPEGPISSVASVTYLDFTGATQTLGTDVYELRADGLDSSIVKKFSKQWPPIQAGSRITVTAVVGYVEVPTAIKQALLLIVGHWFENREAVTTDLKGLAELPMAVEALLSNYRRG